MLSHDRINWYAHGGLLQSNNDQDMSSTKTLNFYYEPCGAGYGSGRYDYPCVACERGTFKPIEGTFNCLSCLNDTYQSMSAQLSCNKCPLRTVSNPRSKSYFDCMCTPGFYYLGGDVNQPCAPCIDGAICDEYNMTIPKALPGFWHTKADPFNYVACFPSVACPGGGFDQCALGYNNLSRVCGECERGYYKWQNACRQCTEGAWYKLLLAVFGLAVITIIFFGISSTKVTHLSSISIAFGFWQILSIFSSFDVQWPVTISDSLTAASLANFNIDFLSPQCVFPEMTFVSKWILITCVPFYFLFAFIVLYLLGLLRAFIVNRTGKYVTLKYKRFKMEEDLSLFRFVSERFHYGSDDSKFKRYRYRLLYALCEFVLILLNMLIWCYNFSLWLIKDGATRRQSRIFLNKIVNSFTALISFLYLFIIQQASQIFVCTRQADMTSTMNASPDIQCSMSDPQWRTMVPLSIIIYVVFGLGYIVMFIVLYLYSKSLFRKENAIKNQIAEMEKSNQEGEILILEEKLEKVRNSFRNFKMEFKFLITRFKIKFFFWELAITGRKLAIAILNTFLPSMLVLIFGLLIMFLSLLLHMQTVPFKKKFHNLMEYIVLISIVLTLFFGLLFFVDDFPTPQFKSFCTVLAIIVIIVSTVIVCLMSVADFLIRRRKENEFERIRRERIREKFGDLQEQELEIEYRKFFPSVFHNVNKIEDQEEWIVEINPLLESKDDLDVDEWTMIINPLSEIVENTTCDYLELEKNKEIEFVPPFYISDAESENDGEDDPKTLNGIISDIFSMKRVRKNLKLVSVGGKKVVKKMRKKRIQ
ncbi:hypothetical protein AKO1_011551, partial [Acrasis kona]